MADTDFQDRTEQATPRRQLEARRRGQVARSREVNMAAVLLAGAFALMVAREHFAGSLEEIMRSGLRIRPALLENPHAMVSTFSEASMNALFAFSPLLVVLALAAIAGAVSVGGFVFSIEPVIPQWNRLNPLQGFSRIVSMQGLVEVLKALAKGLFVAAFAVLYMAWVRHDVVRLGVAPLQLGAARSGAMVTMVFVVCGFAMVLIALGDAPFQLWSHNRMLRMSRQEIREELKESEGRPEVRSRVRALQQQIANRRMLREVPRADVVVTNPTHFAVAIRYDDKKMRAPIVVAKGVDLMAGRIREIAASNRIALFEAPPLARALYWTTNLGQEIPGQLYLAVAQVLTYVYRLKSALQGQSAWPEKPVVTIDETLAQPRAKRRK
jgi:flagellar biosynthetic protein FlhB